MVIELSNLTFTDEDDVVPTSGVEEILINTGIANTLAGNDIIIGTKEITTDTPPQNRFSSIFNSGTLNTADGNDIITGTILGIEGSEEYYGIFNSGTLNTADGNDIITGINENETFSTFNLANSGIYLEGGTIDTGDGNDIITGISKKGFGIIYDNGSSINTGDGNDTIAGTSFVYGGMLFFGSCSIDTGKGDDIITVSSFGGGLIASSGIFLNTGEGNDIISGKSSTNGWGIFSNIPIDTGDGNDIIVGTSANLDDSDGIANVRVGIGNASSINTGNGDAIITGIASPSNLGSYGISNDGTINTGNGDAIISGIGSNYGILNQGTINTGNSKDSLISQGSFFNSGGVFLGDGDDWITVDTGFSDITDTDFPDTALKNWNIIETGEGNDIITSAGVIYNEGTINTGNGEDSIIADGGFQSGSSGIVFLGEGEDYIKGFGSGIFNGGGDQDILELTSGSYTVEILGTAVSFTKDSTTMQTSEFEKLLAGSTMYDFTSLTTGQIITVA